MSQARKLALGGDHAGRSLRRALAAYLLELGHQIQDVGPEREGAVDYPEYAARVCALVTQGACELGILVCGTGLGVSMAANALPGIRAALCTNAFMGKMARAHNDANVLCLGERVIGFGTALTVVEAFLNTQFAGGRHEERLRKLAQLREAP